MKSVGRAGTSRRTLAAGPQTVQSRRNPPVPRAAHGDAAASASATAAVTLTRILCRRNAMLDLTFGGDPA